MLWTTLSCAYAVIYIILCLCCELHYPVVMLWTTSSCAMNHIILCAVKYINLYFYIILYCELHHPVHMLWTTLCCTYVVNSSTLPCATPSTATASGCTYNPCCYVFPMATALLWLLISKYYKCTGLNEIDLFFFIVIIVTDIAIAITFTIGGKYFGSWSSLWSWWVGQGHICSTQIL